MKLSHACDKIHRFDCYRTVIELERTSLDWEMSADMFEITENAVDDAMRELASVSHDILSSQMFRLTCDYGAHRLSCATHADPFQVVCDSASVQPPADDGATHERRD